MQDEKNGQEKSLFNSTERGEIPQPSAPSRDDRPAAEKYPPRNDKPELYSLYEGDVHKDTFTTAAQAWEEFQKHGGKDVSIQPDFGGEILVARRVRTVENQMWTGEREEFDIKVSDNFKRDLVAEGRNPDNPREPLPVAPKREASNTELDQYDTEQFDPTAEQLIERGQLQQAKPVPQRQKLDVLGQMLSPASASVQAMFASHRPTAQRDTVPPEIRQLAAVTQQLNQVRAAGPSVPEALMRLAAASARTPQPDPPRDSPTMTTLLEPPQRRHSLSY